MNKVDVCIIGAGPAGMAAARCAADGGASVLVLDEQATAGGQIYRAITDGGLSRSEILGPDYTVGAGLAEQLDHPAITLQPCSTVWWIDKDGLLAYSVEGKAQAVAFRRLIVATGAVERSYPFPGWNQPGVMMAGAAQILLKAHGIVTRDAVIAGSGPLLYLIAQQLIAAGAPPKALVETQQFGGYLAASRHLFGALRGWRQIAKGLGLMSDIRKARVPRYTGAHNLRVVGEDGVEALTFSTGGRDHRIDCATVLVHQGVIPNLQITRSLLIAHDWDTAQQCWRPRTDAWGTTELENVAVAGDAAGIAGAKAAEPAGRIAALETLRLLGFIDAAERDRRAGAERRELARELAVRPFLDALYAPPAEAVRPPDETVICRCEEVTAGEVRELIRLGNQGPNQVKAFLRSGMGPCQGQYCGQTVAGLFAAETGKAPVDIGYFRIRPPIKPVTLGELVDAGEQISRKQ